MHGCDCYYKIDKLIKFMTILINYRVTSTTTDSCFQLNKAVFELWLWKRKKKYYSWFTVLTRLFYILKPIVSIEVIKF